MLAVLIIVTIFGLGFASGYLLRAEISHRRRTRARQQVMWSGSLLLPAAFEEREARSARADGRAERLPRAEVVNGRQAPLVQPGINGERPPREDVIDQREALVMSADDSGGPLRAAALAEVEEPLAHANNSDDLRSLGAVASPISAPTVPT